MSNCGISFNGVDLGIVSAHFNLIDVVYGAPDISIVTHDVPGVNGEIAGSRKYGSRPITVVFDIMDPEDRRRAMSIESVRQLINTSEKAVFRDLMFPNRYMNAICAQFPNQSEGDWYEDLSIEFLAHDPCWYSDDDRLNVTLNAATTVARTTGFFVDCTEEVYPIIRQTLSTARTDLTWQVGEQLMTLQGAVGPGALVIDCTKYREAVTLAGVDITNRLSLDSTFFRFAPRLPQHNTPHVMTTSNYAGGVMRGKYRWL